MLKIRDDIDLKELEKYGFKPKYDENTGEIIEYYKEYLPQEPDSYYKETIKFYFKTKKRWFKTHKICCGNTWGVFSRLHGYEIMDLIYDLTQANLVEKVSE